MRPQYQQLKHQNENPSNYAFGINLQNNILSLHVCDRNSQTEWQQQFAQKHFPNKTIQFVTKTLQDATKPHNIQKRVKIFSQNRWLHITIDEGRHFCTIRLPDSTTVDPTESYSRVSSTFKPRKLSDTLYQNQKYQPVPTDTEATDEANKPPKAMQIVHEGNENYTAPRFDDERNDIIRFFGISLHIFIVLMSLFYAFLSAVYGYGQLHQLTLSDFWCTEMYSLEQIREYNAIHNNTLGDEYSCYQIHGNVIDYQRLFDVDPSLSYESHYQYDSQNMIFAVLYGIVTLAFLCILLRDILYIIKPRKQTEKKTDSIWNIYDKYVQYCSTDTIGWVILKFLSELMEIVIQAIALLSFGGIDILDWNSNILTEEMWVIVGFAITLLCNGVFNFILWFCYALFPRKVFGYPFVYTLFAVDALFDTLYVIYPMVVRGQVHDLKNSIGIFRVSSIKFIQSIVPLCFLCFACNRGLSQSFYLAKKGKVDPRMKSIQNNRDYINGLFIKCHYEDMDDKFNIDKPKEKQLKKQDCFSKTLLIICNFCLFAFTALVSISVIVDITNSEIFCNQFNIENITEYEAEITEQNIPELVIYDEVCKLKVYKLFTNYPCNCKLVMFENTMMTNKDSTICKINDDMTILFGYSSIDILNNIFIKWDNMIRFWLDQELSNGNEILNGCINNNNNNQSIAFNTKEMFSAKYMQLLYIRNLYLEAMSIEIADHFMDLQYFSVPNTFLDANDLSFNGLSQLPNLKLIQLKNIDNLSNKDVDNFCDLQSSLRSLQIENSYFDDLNDCFANFADLEFLLLNYVGLINLNWDVLNITTLKRLSLFSNKITFESLNNTFISNRIYNSSESMLSALWIGGNTPICNQFEKHEFHSQSANDLVNKYEGCSEGCNDNNCPVYNIGDGFCQLKCNNNYLDSPCNYDNGDCNQ